MFVPKQQVSVTLQPDFGQVQNVDMVQCMPRMGSERDSGFFVIVPKPL